MSGSLSAFLGVAKMSNNDEQLQVDGSTSIRTADGIIDVQIVHHHGQPLRVTRCVSHSQNLVNAKRVDLVAFRSLDLLTHFLIADVKGAGSYIKVGRNAAINLLSKEKISLRAKKRVLPLDSSLVLDCKEHPGQ